jgi:uridine kinase
MTLASLAHSARPVIRHPLFLVGLALRVTLIATVAPHAITDWYAPFMAHSVGHWTTDPWASFVADGGTSRAFPYGYVMWLAFLPLTALASLIGAPVHYGYALTLLVVDIGLLFVLRRLIAVSERVLLALYWCSPIGLFATYWLGLNDIVPITLLCIALLVFRSLRMTQGGLLCGLAVSAKISMILPVPFMLLYLLRNGSYRRLAPRFAHGLAASLAVLGAFYLHSPAAVRMLAGNPEVDKIYDLSLPLGSGVHVYLLPLAILLLFYVAWQMRRMSFELLVSFIGIVFFLVLLLTPAAPGWFLWVLPFLVFYQVQNGRKAIVLAAAFSLFYVLVNLLVTPMPAVLGSDVVERFAVLLRGGIPPRGIALLETALFGFGVVVSTRIWKGSIANNDYFRMSRKPLVIGIAGDSGAGKDTLVDALESLFGSYAVVKLSGDDYHFWDRHKPMWQVMTHLHPRANDLSQFAHDLMALVDKRSVLKRHYDHAVGRKGKPHRLHSNDVIIASGLHALYLPILRECYDLGIYLDIDEDLRRHFKIERDVHARGHPLDSVIAALDRRAPDAARFIHPQAQHADLIFSLRPIHPRLLEEAGKHVMRLKLAVKFRQGLLDEELGRVLVGVCGLHVENTLSGDKAQVELVIEGECSAEDIAMAARHLIPRLSELLDLEACWRDGVAGLMQLITIAHIHEGLRKRLL